MRRLASLSLSFGLLLAGTLPAQTGNPAQRPGEAAQPPGLVTVTMAAVRPSAAVARLAAPGVTTTRGVEFRLNAESPGRTGGVLPSVVTAGPSGNPSSPSWVRPDAGSVTASGSPFQRGSLMSRTPTITLDRLTQTVVREGTENPSGPARSPVVPVTPVRSHPH
jgi:hypothetical protein